MIEGISLALPGTRSVATTAEPIELAVLVDTYSPLLFRVAHSILRNQAEAEDTVQDVFVRVLEHHRKLPEVRDLRVWLVRIAWNLALDRRRRIRPDQIDDAFAGSLVSATLPADVALNQAQKLGAVFRTIDALPKVERQVLLLSALEELDTTEVAKIIGKSESAVRSLLFRARQQLRTRLQKGGHA